MNYKKLYIIPLALAAAGAFNSAAQLHESINVEGKYVPEIIRVDRIYTFPKALNFSLGTTPLDYENAGVAASFSPSLLSMPATGWRDTRHISDNKGYLELGVGSWLNSTLSAGYRFVDNSSTLAGIRLQHNSTSLWKPEMSAATADVKQYRYDESIGIYASHIFKGYGRLDAALDYHLGLFNYYGFSSNYISEGRSLEAPSQTLNDFSLRLDWKSLLSPSSTIAYGATARVRHFAFRSLTLPELWGFGKCKGNRETNVELAGNIRMPWDNGSSIGLDADLNVLIYGGDNPVFSYSPGKGEADITLSRPGNYALLSLTPYYRFTRGLLDIRLGADVDLAFNAGPAGNRYSLFHIAPDVKFALQKGQFGVYLNLLGGSSLNTLANLYQHDYYMMPAIASTRPSYSPVDATLGVNLGPFAGFSIGVEGSFRSSKNVPLGGWYQTWMNAGMSPLSAIHGENGSNPSGNMMYSLDPDGINLHGVSLGGYISYKPSDIFSFMAKGSVQPQNGEKGYFNGYDRPKVTARFEASVKPVSPLKISVGYDLRAKRAIYTRAMRDIHNGSISGDDKGELYKINLPVITLLDLSASWNFTKDFSAWLQADNILNRHDDFLPMLPSQGVVVLAGLKVLF